MRQHPAGNRPGAVGIPLTLLLAVALALPGPVRAQTPSTGAIEGVIRDRQGRALNTVAVTLISRTSGRRQIVRTDRSGQYTAVSVEPGAYDVLVERIGYQPERIEGVVVTAGETRALSLAIDTVEGEVRLRTRAAPATLSSVIGGAPARWFTGGEGGAGVPQEAGDLAGLAALGTSSGFRMEYDGMPAGAHALLVDGLPLAKRPRAFGTYTRLASLPLSFFEVAAVGSGSPDVEYPGQAGGLISAHTSRGGPATTVRAFADFGSDALAFSPDDVASFQSYRFGGVVSGPLARDTANYALGVEYTRFQTPYIPLWAPGSSTDAVVSAASSHGVDLSPYAGAGLAEVERIAAYGRLDARLGNDHRLSARALVASLPSLVPFNAWTESPAAWRGNPEAREIFAAIRVNSTLSDNATNEFSLGYERSEANRQDPEDPAADPPGTVVSSLGRTFGSLERRNADMSAWSVTARETFLVRNGDHRLKFGVAALLPTYDMPWFYARSGEFLFSGPQQLQSDMGAYREFSGDDKIRADFSVRRITLYAQDAWRPRPGVELLAGARISVIHNLDSTDINPNAEWARLAALSNRALKKQYTVFEPHFGLVLTPAAERGLTLRASAAVDADMADPGVLAEVVSNWGLLDVRRLTGATRWPAEPVAGDIPDVYPSLSLLGPEFEGPRTSRIQASIRAPLGAGAVLSAGGSVRRTEYLPRREDLNLLPTVPANDQFGRPIHGALTKSGALLQAQPLSNRRFTEFDQVWGIEATGESRYVGFTVGVERPFANGFGALLSYTWSRTEDDWLTGYPRDPLSQLDPFPYGSNEDWRDGRSDLDVPHRALAGLEVKAPGRVGPRLTALYRFQSGYPFTPGFRPGVDANADGSAVNDVAFVDEGIAGIRELVSTWPCLASQVGGFSERNACRGPDLHALDVRLAIDLGLAGTRDVSIVVDAVNLVATEDGEIDRALYLVDPGADLIVSPDGRSYTVPLVANPDFGQMLNRFTPQRFLRVGLRVRF